MQIRPCAKHAVAAVLVLISFVSSPVLAQRQHAHVRADQQAQPSALGQVVRDATARCQDGAVAQHEGYVL